MKNAPPKQLLLENLRAEVQLTYALRLECGFAGRVWERITSPLWRQMRWQILDQIKIGTGTQPGDLFGSLVL